ncbi:delta(8)-fatty-acid desaturase-like [Silene latifolia]|uniref:delta(8)-fatty-acid desaturase-like n=1 Tax=Silene latifolia TaxID=37657 RepID=UPI003D771641
MGDTLKYISEDELSVHNKKDDLWISISGKIYNVTNWVNNHPGGDLPLLYFAGQDVTNVFLAYHPKSCHLYLDKFFTGYHIKDYNPSEMSQDYRNLWSDFEKLGLFDNKGHGILITMIIAVMLFYASIYGVLTSDSFWVHLSCGGLLGLSWIQFVWITHDSAHYQVMVTPGWNRFANLFIANCVAGLSISWWKKGHNAHHIATNSLEYDPITQSLPVFAQTSKSFSSLTSHFYEKKMDFDSFTRQLISYQHFTFFLSIVFARVLQFVESFNLLLSRKNNVFYRVQELLGLLVFWTWFTLLVLSLPDVVSMIAFVAVTFIVAGIQSFQIIMNHVCCDTYIEPPVGNDWLEKQTRGSLNIACSPWMDWFHGGLQFQIEHHLFPRMPRCQLRNISPMVKKLCEKHNLPYNCANSFWEASAMTLDVVCVVASEARNYVHPVPKKLI